MEKYIYISDNMVQKKFWLNLLDQWLENNIIYIEDSKYNDTIFWHNEVANASCFLSSLWQIGGRGLLECAVTRKNGSQDSGRADLFIYYQDEIEYYIECKFTRICNDYLPQLEKAKDQCDSIKDAPDVPRMGIVFISPCINNNLTIEKIRKSLEGKNEAYIITQLTLDKELTYEGKQYKHLFMVAITQVS